MVIVFAVILAVLCVLGIREMREGSRGSGRDDIPEEVLAELMPGEYPQYKKLFEMQNSLKYPLSMQR